MYVCMYVCMYIYIYVYVYIYIHMHVFVMIPYMKCIQLYYRSWNVSTDRPSQLWVAILATVLFFHLETTSMIWRYRRMRMLII